MIEERAVVRAVQAGAVWVEPLGPQNCPKCAAGQGCGGGLLSRLVRRRPLQVAVDSRVSGLAPGDPVVVGLEEGALLSASIRAYLVPLLGLFTLGGMAHLLFQAHELVIMLAGAAGLAAGLLWLRRGTGHGQLSSRYRPVILRKDHSAGEHCVRLP